MVKCPKCGKMVSEGAFCEKCGCDISNIKLDEKKSKTKFCATCGNVIKEGVRFCPHCGTKIHSDIQDVIDNDYFGEHKTLPIGKIIATISVIVGFILLILVLNIFNVISLNTDVIDKKTNYSEVIDRSKSLQPIDNNGNNYIHSDYNGYFIVDENNNRYHNVFVSADGKDYYVDDKGYIVFDKWIGDYYLGNDGAVVKSEFIKSEDGSTYYVDENGKYVKNKIITNKGKKYYLDESGRMVVEHIFISPDDTSKKMFADKEGVISYADNFVRINNITYYVDSNGYIVSNQWVEFSDKWFYMMQDGSLARNKWIDNTYYVNADGIMLTNTISPEGYIIGSDGKVNEESRNKILLALQQQAQQQAQQIEQINQNYNVLNLSNKILNAKIARETISFTNLDSFDTVQFGSFEQDNNVNNGKELLDWIILEKDTVNHRALLFSKYILDRCDYKKIKIWLNNFYIDAFSSDEKTYVLKSTFEVTGQSNASIISENELNNYYLNLYTNSLINLGINLDLYKSATTKPTQYAMSKGCSSYLGSGNYNGMGAYWYKDLTGSYIKPTLWADFKQSYVGIRPIIWVSYNGTVSSPIQNNDDINYSVDVAINRYESINSTYIWSDDDNDYDISASFKKPIFAGKASDIDTINEAMSQAIDELVELCDEIVINSSLRPRKLTFSNPTIISSTAKKIVLEFSGVLTYQSCLTRDIKYTCTYDRDSEDYSLKKS